MNGSAPYDGINEMPLSGSWYLGMNSDLEFSVDSLSVSLSLTSPTFTATNTTVLYATTSYTGGYVVKAYATYDGRLRLSDSSYIPRWDASNTSPSAWGTNCVDSASYCGFGYTTSDSNLAGGVADRFATSTNYAGFATSSPGDIVADETTATSTSYPITYKASVSLLQAAGVYSTTVYYLCSANY
jgi:hypothetical protein